MAFVFGPGLSSDQPGSYFNKGHNAVWVSHKWVGEESQEADVKELVNNLEAHDIDTVFVHTGPLEPDGTVNPETYKWAMDFIETAKIFNKDIEYQAWLGQIRSSINLSDPFIRNNISKLSLVLTEFVGFDGIHFDIEPVWDGDLDFITLLKETNDMIAEDKEISVALAELIPGKFLRVAQIFHKFKNYNTELNYQNVAQYADQIVVMVYDTSIDDDWLYKWLVKEQTIRSVNLLDDKEVFIAIPAYEDVKDGFNPDVENIKNGLYGLLDGLNDIRIDEKSFAGVAIYSYWEIGESEWQDYEKIWMK